MAWILDPMPIPRQQYITASLERLGIIQFPPWKRHSKERCGFVCASMKSWYLLEDYNNCEIFCSSRLRQNTPYSLDAKIRVPSRVMPDLLSTFRDIIPSSSLMALESCRKDCPLVEHCSRPTATHSSILQICLPPDRQAAPQGL